MSDLTRGIAAMMDQMGQIVEAAAGYKAKAEAQGFSSAISEKMALDFHRHLVELAFSGSKKAKQ